MDKMKEVLFVLATFLMTLTHGLECQISSGKNEERLKKLVKSCLGANDTVDGFLDVNFSTERDENYKSSEETYTGPKRQFNTRAKRSSGYEKEIEDNSTYSLDQNVEDNNVTVVTRNCVIQCVLQRLELTDANGFPVHHRLLEMLMRPTFRRELRDFLQDSTDECFLMLEQEGVAVVDACVYSTKLIACLADKGRRNCADWPVGNLVFQD